MSENVVINKMVNELCDSIEIGTPSKGGAIKVYFNSNDVEGAKKRIDNAKLIAEYARRELSINI